jgi:hypothetical protein
MKFYVEHPEISSHIHAGLFPSCLQNKKQSPREDVGESQDQESQKSWLGEADPSKPGRRHTSSEERRAAGRTREAASQEPVG